MSLDDFSWYRGNLKWLRERTFFLTKHGSHAYGTSTPSSDLDMKGIAIAPAEYYLGFVSSFEQAEVREPLDVVIYDIRKFFKLAADCNPNIIEVLFTDAADWIFPADSKAWEDLHRHRRWFLSRRARHTFSGYAVSQLKRIKTHRRWLLDPPKGKPDRASFGLPASGPTVGKDALGVIESRIRKMSDAAGGQGMTKDLVAEHEEEMVYVAVTDLEMSIDLIPIVLSERRYGNACRQWDAYERWKAERNPARAALEAKHGYDTKHAMHLVRLLRMAEEILARGEVLVKRPDAAELLAIRGGAWGFERILAFAEAQDVMLAKAYETSPLPREPDRVFLDELLVELVRRTL